MCFILLFSPPRRLQLLRLYPLHQFRYTEAGVFLDFPNHLKLRRRTLTPIPASTAWTSTTGLLVMLPVFTISSTGARCFEMIADL